MARASNEKRARQRQVCREALASHIYDRLGIKIDPQAVRLQPAPEDGYAWSITDSKRHLLKSCLSNGTVGLYDEICKEIGHSIEAVRPTGVALGSGSPFRSGKDDSFTATIQRLEVGNHELQEESLRLRNRIEEIQNSSQDWEKKARQLQVEVSRQKSLVKELQRELSSVRRDVQEALHLLGRYQSQA